MQIKSYALRCTFSLITFLAGAICYSYGSYYGGEFEAYIDLMRGTYSIRAYGTQDGDEVIYKEILKKEYDIEVVAVAGCIVSEQLKEKTSGYNEVMNVAIEKRYGLGILVKLWRRAQSEYKVAP